MSGIDAVVLVARWLHILSAVAWIGGCIFFLAVLLPPWKRKDQLPHEVMRSTALRFRTLVDICIVVLVISGGLLAFDRLTDSATSVSYVIVLSVKVALTAWMFILVQLERRSSAVLAPYRSSQPAGEKAAGRLGVLRVALSGFGGVTVLGIAVFLLSDILRALFENALQG